VARTFGHLQEVILQPHSPGRRQRHPGTPFDLRSLPEVSHGHHPPSHHEYLDCSVTEAVYIVVPFSWLVNSAD
jgi:hypothetical protein